MEITSTRYAIFTGYVGSQYISAKKLAALYGVPLKTCVIIDPKHDDPIVVREREAQVERENLVQLHPRADGNYKLPETQP